MLLKTIHALSDLELAILGLARSEPRSGYAIRKALPPGSLSDSPGAIYPALKRLRDGGLLEGVADTTTARGTEVFRLTAAGRRALKAALEAPVTDEEMLRNPERQMLRFTFMPLELPPEAIVTFVDQYGAAATRRVHELKNERIAADPHAALAIEHAIELYEARARWAGRASKEVALRRKR